ncbi:MULTISPECIES: hypothetical protein, partial [unclassified Aeromicrobium]|uniref:hypothetical protein n=1 Tax=unclassified Aeromicrobium TaxID=2633570 RepID=UPI00396B1BA6
RKHDGSLPIVGVNTFKNPHGDEVPQKLALARAPEDEKQSQLRRLHEFQQVTEAFLEVGGQYRRNV